MKSCNFTCKYTPVMDRLVETYLFPHQRKEGESGFIMLPRRDERVLTYWKIRKTSRPKSLWAVQRIKVKRIGQKDFFPILLKEMA